jgi:crossover junction endodeoxyribonuclease RuvC
MGVGVVETAPSSYKLIYYDVLRLSSSESLSIRIGKIFDYIKNVIEEYKVDAVSIEDVFTSINPRSALKLGQGRGAAIAAAKYHGLDVYEYSAREVKKAISSYGAAGKDQVAKMVGLLLGVKDIKPYDATDALAISICHINTVPSKISRCEL